MSQKAKSPASGVLLQSLSDVEMEPIRWLWDGYLARGKFQLLAGHAGVSKTTLALKLAATVTTGSKWPDGTEADIGNVLIWSGEDDSSDTIKPRLLVNGADERRVYVIAGARDAEGKPRPFDPAEDMAALNEAAKAISGGVALLVVDPIVSAIKGDSHKNAEVRRDLQALVDLGAELDCAVIGITHLTKGTKGARIGERVTGSLAFNAVARIVIGCAQMPEGEREHGRVAFFRTKSNIGPDSGGWLYDIEQKPVPRHDGIFATKVEWRGPIDDSADEIMSRSEDGSPQDRGKTELAKQFLEDILAAGPLKASDILAEGKAEGLSQTTLRRAKGAAGIRDSRWGFGKKSLVWWYVVGTLPDDWDEQRTKWVQGHQK